MKKVFFLKGQKAFSLTEISIVLVIIGLVLSLVMAGQHLLKIAEINKVIAETKMYADAIKKFEEKYHSLPGDMPNAEILWSKFDTVTNREGTIKGNENGLIDITPREDLAVYQHLSKAGFIKGHYYPELSNGSMVAGKTIIEANIPDLDTLGDNAGLWVRSYNSLYNHKGNVIQISSKLFSDHSMWSGGAVDPEDARLIDKKIDDGLAYDGKVVTINDDDISKSNPEACVDEDQDAPVVNYIPLHKEYNKCQLIIWLNKI